MTKQIKRQKNLLLATQLLIMLGMVAFLVVYAFVTIERHDSNGISEMFAPAIVSLAITVTITSVMLIIVGHRVRNTIWMFNVLMGAYLFGTTGLWTIFVVWLIDEYIIYPLYNRKKTQLISSKLIDKRIGQ